MYELAATLQFAQTISNVLIFAQSVEATIYDLDAKFQSHVVPWVTERAIATFIAFIRAAYLTFIAGGETREWFDAWFATYCLDGVPAVETLLIEEPILMIEAPKTRIAGLLMSATEPIAHAIRQVKPQAVINEQWILGQIRPSAIALDLVNKMAADDKAFEVAVTPKPKRTRKTKTETTGKPAPKGRKPAGISPRKSPTIARVGNHVAAID